MTPVDVLLDVDGCLLMMHDKEHQPGPVRVPGWGDGEAYSPSNGWQVYSPTLVSRIATLAAQPHVTVTWCTSWGHYANTRLSPLIGLPGDWPVVRREVAPEYLDERPNNRVVWVDDDLWLDDTTRDWFGRNQRRGHPVVPNSWLGIRPAQMRRIERLAALG